MSTQAKERNEKRVAQIISGRGQERQVSECNDKNTSSSYTICLRFFGQVRIFWKVRSVNEIGLKSSEDEGDDCHNDLMVI